jgi:hypothetical protein
MKESKMFVVPDELATVVKGIYDTFIDFEKDKPIVVYAKGTRRSWLSVVKKPGAEDDVLWVTGAMEGNKFMFYGNAVRGCFEVVDKRIDMENFFYRFVNLTAAYRIINKLPPLDTSLIDGLAAEDSPPLSRDAYDEAPPDDYARKLIGIMKNNFFQKSFMERHGRFCYFICSDMGRIPYMPLRYIPVYTGLIQSFKKLFSFNAAQLFAVRWAGKQRLFFIAEHSRLYCCTKDGSLEFLKENFDYITRTLAASSFGSGKPPSLPAKLLNTDAMSRLFHDMKEEQVTNNREQIQNKK